MVGVAGFEPATTRTPSVCATRLRHTPTLRPTEPPRKNFAAETHIIMTADAKLQPRHGVQVVAVTEGRKRLSNSPGDMFAQSASLDSRGS